MGKLVAIAMVAAACGGAPVAQHHRLGAAPAASGVRGIDWRNHTYALDDLGEAGQTADVKDGQAALPGGVVTIGATRFGDVDGDGADDAVISASVSSGAHVGHSVVWVFSARGGSLDHPIAMTKDGIADLSLAGDAIVIVREDRAQTTGYRSERWTWRDGAFQEDLAARAAASALVDPATELK